MLQVRCPSCRRLLDVPEGSERATAVCPACRAAFVPEQAVAANPALATTAAELATGIQERPHRKFGRKTRRRRVPPQFIEEPSSPAWRLAKIVFWIAVLARAALALTQHRTRDELFLDLLFAPLFAVFIAAIVVVIKGTFFGWSGDGRPSEFGWLLWPFVAGSLVTGSVVLGAAMLRANVDFGEAIGPTLMIAPFGGLLISLTAVLLAVTPVQLREFFWKFRQAGRPETDFQPQAVNEPQKVPQQTEQADYPRDAFTPRQPRPPDTSVYTDPPRSSETP